jgi:hypothetical protein
MTHGWEIPLIPVIEVTQVMMKLKYFFKPRNGAVGVIHDQVQFPNRLRGNSYIVVPSNTPSAQ